MLTAVGSILQAQHEQRMCLTTCVSVGVFSQAIAMYDTGEDTLFSRPYFANASGTLEGYLLDAWFTGNNTYDALFVDSIPNSVVCVPHCSLQSS